MRNAKCEMREEGPREGGRGRVGGGKKERKRAKEPRYIPSLLTFLAFQGHCHHSPSQVFHALLVWQLGLCPSVEPPDLRGQWVLSLQFLGVLASAAVGHLREDGIGQHAVMGSRSRSRGTEGRVEREIIGHHVAVHVWESGLSRLSSPNAMMQPVHGQRRV